MKQNQKNLKRTVKLFTLFGVLSVMMSCGGGTTEGTTGTETAATESDPMKNKGIGPITSVTIGPLDQAMADKGMGIFTAKCSACHKWDVKYVGPALKGVTKRRTPEWIMNQILNPAEMTQKDPIAKELLGTYLTQMTFQDVSQEDVRAMLEYFRSMDAK